ncbi:asparagine--tRNA ligase chloroplastic/mitochondrial [Phtheirospermum japonicum]|uniref:asparagine--tRNA ligase n=1 Tax=Phtheirospermum japonicum TaxID=374723 RepID=A0A830C5D5_9LAMI|nr:asparagine--tRNA ligase chloroplastic/mitochondrial [Phtheirospermum japonicum]
MAAAISPAAAATTLRFLRPFYAAAPLSSLFSNPRLRRSTAPQFLFSSTAITRHQRSFCSVVSAAVSSGEATKPQPVDMEKGAEIREFRKKLKIVDIKSGADQGLSRLGETHVVRGWVRTLRAQSSVTFIEVNDGSCLSNMQCVMSPDAEGYDQVESGLISTGASVWIQGTIVASQGSKQKVELKVDKLVMVNTSPQVKFYVAVGKSDPSFPIQKKRVSREFLRTKAHLRPRTNTFSAVSRVRNALAYATHRFFQENGFVWLSSPIITASDCEGAGEQFCVTTLVPNTREVTDSPASSIPKTKDGLIDWSQDFFGKPAFLTVSGQLNAETYATALTDVYTFGPTFRAENSNTSRHLAEFWMIEPELAFADLEDDMACATAYLQYVVQYILENCKEDMDFFNTWIEKGIIDRLSDVVEKNFVQLTYTDAVEILLKAKKKFEFPVTWGCDLQSEHERYITEEVFSGCPEIKAFYMRENDDGKTVAAMDMLVPRVGELIGGSQREERLEYLEQRLDDLKLSKESYWWYLDLRRYGSVPHAGFGLGFERLVQFATGIDNIRDAIPFPRAPGSAEF